MFSTFCICPLPWKLLHFTEFKENTIDFSSSELVVINAVLVKLSKGHQIVLQRSFWCQMKEPIILLYSALLHCCNSSDMLNCSELVKKVHYLKRNPPSCFKHITSSPPQLFFFFLNKFYTPSEIQMPLPSMHFNFYCALIVSDKEGHQTAFPSLVLMSSV